MLRKGTCNICNTVTWTFCFCRYENPITNIFTNMKSDNTFKVQRHLEELIKLLFRRLCKNRKQRQINSFIFFLYNFFRKFFNMLLMLDILITNLLIANVYGSHTQLMRFRHYPMKEHFNWSLVLILKTVLLLSNQRGSLRLDFMSNFVQKNICRGKLISTNNMQNVHLKRQNMLKTSHLCLHGLNFGVFLQTL